MEVRRIKATELSENPIGLRVTAVVSYSKGFACSLGSGRVCLFVKNQNDTFTRSRDIWVRELFHLQAGSINYKYGRMTYFLKLLLSTRRRLNFIFRVFVLDV